MTFANGLARSVALTALALGSLGVVNAQNGTNYHVLNNGTDAAFTGIGAGDAQTDLDGIGTYIPGEDCRGSLKVDPDGAGALLPQFCYRNAKFREMGCLFGQGLSGFVQIRFPAVYFIELNGLNSNNNFVFTRPLCATPITASAIAYGVGPGSSGFSFVNLAVSAVPFTPPIAAHNIIAPDNGLVNGSGTATLVAAAGNVQIPPGTGSVAPGFCYGVQFTWTPSVVTYLDNIDAIYHYAVNSDDGNQYWGMSDDEMNLWQSQTIVGDAGLTAVGAFFSVLDYELGWASREAETTAILAPNGIEQAGPYYAQTENMTGGGGPNFGFDVGRGSHAISFTGLGGVKVPAGLGGLGNGAQDPAYGGLPLNVKTMGFATWDNKPNISVAGEGSGRITWISVDLSQVGGGSPETDPDITKVAGTVKIPVVGAGFIQPTTSSALTIFQHVTKAATSGWPDPSGFASGAFGVPAIAGGSIQFNVGPFVNKVPCNIAVPINITYGTSGKDPFPPPTFTWDPASADISGSKELYLWK